MPDKGTTKTMQVITPEPPLNVTEIERDIAALLKKRLFVREISRTDSFFDLGGHSLSAVQASAAIAKAFSIPFALNDLRNAPTVAGIAQKVQARLAGQAPPPDSLNTSSNTPTKGSTVAAIPVDGEASAGRLSSMKRREGLWTGIKKRLFQVLALYAPGSTTLRVRLHRARGVRIGQRVMIGTDVMIDTSCPHLVSIGNNVQIGIRSVFIAHFGDMTRTDPDADPTIRVEDDVYIGPSVTILPNVTIGTGAVVTAGSVVNQSVPPASVVQGNPARPVARCAVPLAWRSYCEFTQHLSSFDAAGNVEDP